MFTFGEAAILNKWNRINAGQRVVIGDAEHSAMCDYFAAHDGPAADKFFRELRSIPNPNRLGVHDGYLAWID